jgi:hypothetical protein
LHYGAAYKYDYDYDDYDYDYDYDDLTSKTVLPPAQHIRLAVLLQLQKDNENSQLKNAPCTVRRAGA